MRLKLAFSLFAGSALMLASTTASGQEPEPPLEDGEIIEIEVLDDPGDAEAGRRPGAGTRFGRELALPANVIQVRSVEGELQPPFAQSEYCTETQCGMAVVNTETGHIAFAFGQWQPRYIETRRGAQILYVKPEPVAQPRPDPQSPG